MIKYHRHWHTGTHLCWTCNCCRSRNNPSVPFQSTHESQNDFHENSCTVEVFNDSRKGKKQNKTVKASTSYMLHRNQEFLHALNINHFHHMERICYSPHTSIHFICYGHYVCITVSFDTRILREFLLM